MRNSICLAFVLTTLSGCKDVGGYYDSGEYSGQEEYISQTTWLNVTAGNCLIEGSRDGGASWRIVDEVTAYYGGESAFVHGDIGEMLKVQCEWAGPGDSIPSVQFDDEGCPLVYCNPWGGTNRLGGEHPINGDEGCGNNLQAYVEAEGFYRGDWAECGPWDLE